MLSLKYPTEVCRICRLSGLCGRTVCLVFLLCLLQAQSCFSQAGSIDPAFIPALEPGADVYAVAIQPDGKILVGGSFVATGSIRVTNLARLNVDGSLDTTFNPATAVDLGYVNSLAIQPNGRIVVGGDFYSSRSLNQGILTRLNSDGTEDSSFDYNLFIDSAVNAIVLQPDGKIVIGGLFVVVDFALRRNIARLNPDGTLDYAFDACVAASDGSGASSLALQTDGKIIAAGNFSFSTGTTRTGIARLQDCGDLDPDYAPEPGVDSTNGVFVVRLRPDNTLLFGGTFREYHSSPRGGLAQLGSDGIVDTNFHSINGIEAGKAVYAVLIAPDGSAIIGGNFVSYNAALRSSVARVNSDGSLDQTYHTGSGADNSVSSLALQTNGSLVVGGKFGNFDGVPRNGLCRLRPAPAQPRLGIPSRLADLSVMMILFGEVGTHYSVEASTNLTAWQAITNFTAINNNMPVRDRGAGPFDRRFYRALLQ